MGEWRCLAGVIEWRVDYPVTANQPLGIVLVRSAFLVVRPEGPPSTRQRTYRWRMAEMGLLGEDPPHPLPHRPDAKIDPTDVTSWLWPGASQRPDDPQWVSLDHFGATVGNPRSSSQGDHGLRDLLDPIWYGPAWGELASGTTVPVAAFAPEVLDEHVRFTEIGTFFCSPGVEAVRVDHNPELDIVESVVSLRGDEEIAWLRLESVTRLA